MTLKEIQSRGKIESESDNSGSTTFKVKLELKVFRKEVQINVYNLPLINNKNEWDLITVVINELLDFSEENLLWLKDVIWEHYEMCIKNTDYGIADYGNYEDHLLCNKEYFQIFNKEQSYKKAILKYIWIDINFLNHRYFNLCYDCPWEGEHGINIGVKNGMLDSIE